ncbi:hypothetical protein GA0115251_110146 [Streptomyces sp. TverLS-915]|uniref:DUF6328 family protein n=1 Tax=Streptomyces sp. TverLS-915 TaxID=1839763 RepID=UPI00081E9EF3|nr:DUF6328 family protein [Streptomyces sp. TverLS-915]SCD51863.1 hypothetical protein GA0115251_110146 [Streptomyces sp. TverLS-915]
MTTPPPEPDRSRPPHAFGGPGAPDPGDETPAPDHPDGTPAPRDAAAPGRRPGATRTPGRSETREERADRKWADLLQELRVAQTGVQILFGFLLTVVFQQRFTTLSDTDRMIYVVTVVLGAATTGALVAPVSFHRLLSGQRLKPETVRWAGRLTLVGLALLLATMASSMLLILRVVVSPDDTALWLVAGIAAWFALCWFAFPAWARHAARRERGGTAGDGGGTEGE